jgi:hypothetical protein
MSEPRLTKRQAAIIGAYTGSVAGPFSDIHEIIEEVLGRPIWTHQLIEDRIQDEIHEKFLPLFLEICHEPD